MADVQSIPDAQFLNLLRSHLKYLKPGASLESDQQLKSLGLDSMAAVDLLLDIEDIYGVTLPDHFLTEETFSTARALWHVVEQLQNGGAAKGSYEYESVKRPGRCQ